MAKLPYPVSTVIIVDDDEQFLNAMNVMLRASGIDNIALCHDSRDAMGLIRQKGCYILILDISMPYISGVEILKTCADEVPEVPVLIISAMTDIGTAVECMKIGALDYLVKPVDDERVIRAIKNAIEMREIEDENIVLKEYLLNSELKHPEAFESIITISPRMFSLFQYVEAIAPTPFPVLITGETGVGKELFADVLHRLSNRNGRFVTVNVAGFDDTLFADTLFGHSKGAYTGADEQRKGLIEQATGGTLFLDEIGDLSLISQAKLLRVIQEREYFPLGSDVPKLSDVRIIVATNKSPISLKDKQFFRADLYYRLKTHHVAIPPLRERMEDIPVLVDFFLEEAAKALKKRKPTPPKELYALLSAYDFSGNIRELRSMIFDAVSMHKSKVLSMDIFKKHIEQGVSEILRLPTSTPGNNECVSFHSRLPTIQMATEALIAEALRRSKGNQSIAAGFLGISPQALSRRLKHRKIY